jgi:hypothetical protein
MNQTHSPFFKPCPYANIDIYRVLELFQVTDPALQQAAKKILAGFKRDAQQASDDIQQAIDALVRWQEMRDEEEFVSAPRAGRRPGDPIVVTPARPEVPSIVLPPMPQFASPPAARRAGDAISPIPQRRSTDLPNTAARQPPAKPADDDTP